MQRQRMPDPRLEPLQQQLRQSLFTRPRLLDDVEPEESVRLLVALLISQTQRDLKSLNWRLEIRRLFYTGDDPHVPGSVFYVHTPPWKRLVEYLLSDIKRCHPKQLIAILFPLLQVLDSEAHQEETELEASVVRTLADGLPYLTAEELQTLPEPLWEFLEEALRKRTTVHWQQRKPWMKADFTVAALLTLATMHPQSVTNDSVVRKLADSDTDERVREAARDYLATR